MGNVDDRRLAAGHERAGEIDEPRVCGRVRGRDQYPVGALVLSLPLLAEGRVGVDEWDVRPARGAAQQPLRDRQLAVDAVESGGLQLLLARLEVVDDGHEDNTAKGVAQQNRDHEVDESDEHRQVADKREVQHLGKGNNDVIEIAERDRKKGDIDGDEPGNRIVGGVNHLDDASDDQPRERRLEEQRRRRGP